MKLSLLPRLLLAFFSLALVQPLIAQPVQVATLHPVLTDIAKKVGGNHIVVTQLISNGESSHTFSPSLKDLEKAKHATLYFAAGKGSEPYLPKLRSILPESTEIIEVGKTIPSIVVSKESELFACCPNHAHGGLDPHWWNSVKNIRLAVNVMYKALGKADPDNKDIYKANAKAYRAELDLLNDWVKRELSSIPKEQRYLATAHAAFGYFCKEYKWKSIPIHGINAEQSVDPKHLATAIHIINEKQLKAIFPEKRSNPKTLQTIAKSTSTKIGKPLIADGSNDVIAMFKHNINSIVTALK